MKHFVILCFLSGLLASDLQNDLEVIYERRLEELVTDNYDLILAAELYVWDPAVQLLWTQGSSFKNIQFLRGIQEIQKILTKRSWKPIQANTIAAVNK